MVKRVFHENAAVIENREVAKEHFRMVLDAPKIGSRILPGQFVHVRCSDAYDPLLRRPFSLHRKFKDKKTGYQKIEILYKVVGKGTKILSEKIEGDKIDIIGPLGNGFSDITTDVLRGVSQVIFAAGGMGVAPLLGLADGMKNGFKGEKHFFMGAKNKSMLLCVDEFRKLGFKIHLATDDGSRGHKGFVTELVEGFLKDEYAAGKKVLFTCGPKYMLCALSRQIEKYDIHAEASLEENMACGVGACRGCGVRMREPGSVSESYKMVCKDGPVFNIKDILWQD